MGRPKGIWRALNVKHKQNDLLFGVVCMAIGALALSLSWFALRGKGDAPRANIGVGVNSNTGLVGEVVPNGALEPLHRRSN